MAPNAASPPLRRRGNEPADGAIYQRDKQSGKIKRVASRLGGSKIPPLFALRDGAGPSMVRTVNDPIEVEVLEIDGAAPMPAEPSEPAQDPSWQKAWQGKVRTLDMRWWPLWVILGIAGVMLLLTVGLVVGSLVLVFRLINGIVGGILRLFLGTPSDTRLSR